MKSHSLINILFISLFTFCLQSCTSQTVDTTQFKKTEIYKGFNFTGTPYEMKDFASFDSLQNEGVNWVSFSPFHYMRGESSPSIIKSFPRQWHSESPLGISQQTIAAHESQLKVMVKPHIWVMSGGFTGNISLQTESGWKEWQKGYTEYIIEYAHVCESQQADMFCIGNELKSAVKQDPKYWNRLIDSVRTIYSGKLTYAANWDNFEEIPFWNKLDVIGINAYFPISSDQNPDVKSIKKGWSKWINKIRVLKTKTGKPIVFTELGYRATSYCCKSPWDYSDDTEKKESCQEMAYKTFFDHIFAKEIEGVFIWKFFDHNDSHIERDLYSPQNRSSWNIIIEKFKD